jgi:hypothetical protein
VSCGRKGTGKTTIARLQVDALLRAGRDLAIVHDPQGQYFGRVWLTIDDFREAEDVAKVNCFRRASPGALAELAVELSGKGLRVVLVLDELTRACTPHRYCDDKPRKNASEWEPGNLSLIVNEGRHYRIDLVGTTRRPSGIHQDLPALAERITVFSLTHSNDLEWVEENCSKELRQEVENLGEHDCAVYDPGDVSDLRRKDAARDGNHSSTPKASTNSTGDFLREA